ncbi:MAG: preprotein translocase subunit SecY [Clostridia bacterium]|nr:preprotein translocase subunit SecY [Clostridia bacterium]MBR1686894.1 preprotein translocase subunit SecY [Clostridia bacterium]
MWDSLKKMWNNQEIRKKLVYTFLMLLLYRLVSVIPAPGIDPSRVGTSMDLPLLQLVNMMTGNSFSQMTIMAMGITPYINASIIMQLLCIAIPALERLSQDESGEGREKINRITRYVTVGLAALQAIGLVAGLNYMKSGWLNYLLVGISMAGGTAFAMWLGEQITDKGIGNGISLLIFVGIISNLFNGIVSGFTNASVNGTTSGWVTVLVVIVVAIIMTILVTFVELGERRIPLQIAKQTKGRRVYGGQNTRLTLKVVSVGVMPLIFAYSFLAFPSTIIQLVDPQANGGFTKWWLVNMSNGSVLYVIISALLIIAFTYFYSSISFDPKKQAEQLIMQGATIPGQRGKNMRAYLQNTVNHLNLFAALFLAVLSAVPTLLTRSLNASVPYAASSILIAVSVSLETIRTIQGEMSIRGIDMDVEKGGFM